jgi:uncharacterized protein
MVDDTRPEAPAPSTRRPRSANPAIVTAAALLAIALAAGMWIIGSAIEARTSGELTVTGSARAPVRSDRAVWTIAASDQADDVATAIGRTSGALDAVTDYLVAGGIDPSAITLDALSTNVNYEWIDGNLTSNVSSYGAYRNLTVRTDDVDAVARLSAGLGDVLGAGVFVSAFPPEYYVTSLPELRPALLEAAVEDAVVRAEAMLRVTGIAPGPVRSVRSGPFQVTAPDSVDVSDAGMYDTSTIDKTVTATVTVTFAAG